MADRYWVGGSGTWDSSSTTNWSATSGGSGGASVPTGSDSVFVDANSGSPTITLSGAIVGFRLNTTGATCTFTGTGTLSLGTTYGVSATYSIIFSTTTTWNATGLLTLGSFYTSGGAQRNLDTKGVVFNCSIDCVISNLTFRAFNLLSDLVLSSTSTLKMTQHFFANTYNVTAQNFILDGSANFVEVRMGSGTWTATGTGTVWSFTGNVTMTQETSTILLSDTSASDRTFAGGSKIYHNLVIGGTAGVSKTTFTGSNTFNIISSTKTVAHTLEFTASTTTTFTDWTISGTAGNLVTIQSATAANHTLAKAGNGVVDVDYLSISRSTATPTSRWYAGTNSTDGGNNSGWIFGNAPPTNGNFFLLFA